MEHETFLSLLGDAAHWEFEIFVTIVFDMIVVGMMWPFIKKHWQHHIESDEMHGFDEKPNKRKKKHK